MRRINCYKVEGKNSLRYLYKHVNFFKVVYNFTFIYLAKYTPWFELKNFLYKMVGIKIGADVSVGLAVVMDIMYPQHITIGKNCVIGYNSTILCHEYLIDQYRIGNVEIGKNVLIGANCTILPGVKIGDNSTVSACSLVNSDIPANSFYGGVPAKLIRKETKNEK